jgi:hypothetical protein
MAVPGVGSQAKKGSMPVSGTVRAFALSVQNSYRSQPTGRGKRRNGGLRTHRVSCVTKGASTGIPDAYRHLYDDKGRPYSCLGGVIHSAGHRHIRSPRISVFL